jgi:hypothetical protein
MNDTLLPDITSLLDARLAPPQLAEEQDAGSEVEAVYHWLADLAPGPDQNDEPALTNGY